MINELIETLWNVNKLHYQGVLSGSDRINRNIVECKFKKTVFIMPV